MLIARKALILTIGLTAIFSACSTQQVVNSENKTAKIQISREQTPAKDDIAELNSIVLLPNVPEEVIWREEVDGKNHKKLVAVMRFSQEDEKNIIEKAKRYREPESAEVSAEDWFPPELSAQTELAGDETLKGISYSAKDFIQLPYTSGRLVKISNSDYFVLELSTE